MSTAQRRLEKLQAKVTSGANLRRKCVWISKEEEKAPNHSAKLSSLYKESPLRDLEAGFLVGNVNPSLREHVRMFAVVRQWQHRDVVDALVIDELLGVCQR